VNKKPTIRIIKKKERLAGPAKNKAPQSTELQDANAMAKTISTWVREFRNRDLVLMPSRQKSGRRKAA